MQKFHRLLRDIHRAGQGTPAEIALRRQARLSGLIEFARTHSPFYRKSYASLPEEIRDLQTLPPVTKHDLMENFDRLATDPAATRETAETFVADPSSIGRLYLGRHVAFATSGTTGRPAILLHDRDAIAVSLALLVARRFPTLVTAGSLWPLLRSMGRTATIITTGGHFASSVIDALVRTHFPRLSGRNRTFSLVRPLPELVRALHDYQPAIIGSYPTALTVLAGEQSAGRLRIRPALALSGAERLSPPARQQIAAAFRCPVRDTYAASEFLGIAFDCRRGRLHVNADWLILEPVDAAGRPVPPGQASYTTLLTNLANRVQPLIRYDLGDSVTVLPAACPCGNPLPTIQVEGRCDEILFLETSSGEKKPMIPMVLATVVEEIPGVRSYQLIQTGPRRLRLRIEEAPGFVRPRVRDDVVRQLRAYLSAQDLASVAIESTEERPLREASGGKLRQIFVKVNGS